MSTYTMAAVQARTLAGEMVPMDASQAGEGKLAFTLRLPDRRRRSDLAVQLPAQPRRPQDRARARRRLRGRPQARVADAALGAAAGRARDEAGLPAGWLNVVVGPSSEIGDVLVEDERVKLITFTGSGAVGWELRERAPRSSVGLELGNATPVIVEADADRRGRCDPLRRQRVLLRRTELHLGAAHLRAARRLRRLQGALRAEGRGTRVGDPADEDTDVGPLIAPAERDRVLAWIEQARAGGATVLTGGVLEGDLLRPTVVEKPARRRASRVRRGVRPGLHAAAVRHARRGDRARECDALRPAGRLFTASLASALRRPAARVRRRHDQRGADVPRRPDAVRRRQGSGNTREGPAWAVREMTEERLVVVQL